MGVVSQQFAISLHFRAGKIIHDILPNCNTKLQIGCNFMLWNIAARKNTILNGLRCLQVAAAYLLALSVTCGANAVFLHDSTRENGIPERPQTLRYSEIINIFSLAYAQSASGGHSKSSRPERGAAFSGSYRCSRPCRRGRHESRSCGSPRGRGGCSGRWGQRPACRQDKPPQRCRRRR